MALTACGFDGVFLTPRGFDATEPPRASIGGLADPGSTVLVLGPDGKVLAQAETTDGSFELALPPGPTLYSNLRVSSLKGRRRHKGLVPFAPKGEVTGVGTLDSVSTGVAQLVANEVISDSGSSFAATPPTALAALLQALTSSPSAELGELVSVVGEIDQASEGEGAEAFNAENAELDPAFGPSTSLGADIIERYSRALSAASRGVALEVRCDPTKLNALFTVDMSGRGRDGNGAPQLIRQASKESRVFIGLTLDESSPARDDAIPNKLTPNDPAFAMTDDGRNGDELAGDGVFSIVVPLPRGARLLYKYTNGSAREGFTGTEEWPGNARILEIEDVLTGRPDGEPDCLIVRRDSFGDEASNKNFVNLNAVAKKRGGTLAFDADLGGAALPAGASGSKLGGLSATDGRSRPPLTPEGVPEARENGVCQRCPAPLALDPDDDDAPAVVAAERLSTSRVRVRFSEPLSFVDASDVTHYEYVDAAERSIRVRSARPSGSEVSLELDPVHPREPARLFVKSMRDVSARGNLLERAEVDVAADRTPPRMVSVRALGLLDVIPTAQVDDPTRGEIVEIELDERPENSAAEDPSRYRIEGLEVFGAELLDLGPPTVRLRTSPQNKSSTYVLEAVGLRDDAGNAAEHAIAFRAFALYKVRFGVVPGFAYLDAAGTSRGLPRGEKLYLTQTPLLFARDLAGRSISITKLGGRRPDVTGYPSFELQPSQQLYEGQPVYTLEVLLPPGSWAWKAAHGAEGEYTNPPTTLEKVYKVLATTNDATGVRVDPVTMRADDGSVRQGARLSATGDDPARRSLVFKREAPDEVCEVASRDTECPFILIGTWRDLVLDQSGTTKDYDDGVPALQPHRPSLPDFAPPKLLGARARDSSSILLAFDEALSDPMGSLSVQLSRADDGLGTPVSLLPSPELPANQAVVTLSQGATMNVSTAYTLRYRGATDTAMPVHVDRVFRTATVLAPDRIMPFTPIVDTSPPSVSEVIARDLDVLEVVFDEAIDPASLTPQAFIVRKRDGSGQVATRATELLPDRSRVRLTVEPLEILAQYELEVRGVADVADPPNAITTASAPFAGFGERDPPQVSAVQAIGASELAVVFSERMDSASVLDPASYRLDGASVVSVAFSGDQSRRRLAFNSRSAPAIETIARIRTSPLDSGRSYTLSVNGAKDRSANVANVAVGFVAAAAPPTVTVVLEYQVSDGISVAGQTPSRAISQSALTDAREGVFVIGARADEAGRPIPGSEGPVNSVLRGFPEEGAPLDGIEPQLADDGTSGDLRAGDGVFSLAIPGVPLGTTIVWKAFAPYKTSFRDRNPTDSAAAFADPVPGPSAFADGQEFPGNENGAVIVAGQDVVRVRCIYGDEITYKKFSGGPAFVWVANGFAPSER